MSDDIRPGVYEHYKGGLYKYLTTAVHTESGEKFVIYQRLYDEQKVWARPLYMWNELVTVTEQLGDYNRTKQIPRFRWIREA